MGYLLPCALGVGNGSIGNNDHTFLSAVTFPEVYESEAGPPCVGKAGKYSSRGEEDPLAIDWVVLRLD